MIQWLKQVLAAQLSRLGLMVKPQSSCQLKRQFRRFGINSKLKEPIAWVLNPQFIEIGDEVVIHPYVRLVACDSYPPCGQTFKPVLSIGDGTNIGWFVSIQTNHKVQIGKKVMMGSYVSISDLEHSFLDVSKPVMDQPLSEGGHVVIEDECYIGNGAKIVPNVTIGKHSVVGMGAVVTKDVPAYTVVAGNPAIVIRRYDFASSQWVRENSKEKVDS